MDGSVLAYLDFLKGNLKMMLLRQYRNLHLIKVFLWIEQLMRVANNSNLNELVYLFMQSSYEILRDLLESVLILVLCSVKKSTASKVKRILETIQIEYTI